MSGTNWQVWKVWRGTCARTPEQRRRQRRMGAIVAVLSSTNAWLLTEHTGSHAGRPYWWLGLVLGIVVTLMVGAVAMARRGRCAW